MGFFSRLFGKSDEPTTTEPARGSSKEEALAAYVVREHRQGRSLEDILDDPYLKNRDLDEDKGPMRIIANANVDAAAVASRRTGRQLELAGPSV